MATAFTDPSAQLDFPAFRPELAFPPLTNAMLETIRAYASEVIEPAGTTIFARGDRVLLYLLGSPSFQASKRLPEGVQFAFYGSRVRVLRHYGLSMRSAVANWAYSERKHCELLSLPILDDNRTRGAHLWRRRPRQAICRFEALHWTFLRTRAFRPLGGAGAHSNETSGLHLHNGVCRHLRECQAANGAE